VSGTSLDYTKTGFYKNYDFIYYVYGVTGEWVGITASASVQYVNGGPNWGASYTEFGTPLSNFFPQWFLSGIITGTASQNCDWVCAPDQWTIIECESQSGPEFAYRWDYDLCMCTAVTPIIVDIDGDGLSLTSPGDGVVFDIAASGRPVRLAWTAPDADDAFLVLDRNRNGRIDDGTELFGDSTPQPNVDEARRRKERKDGRNGFRALGVYDLPDHGGNGDSLISEEDQIFASLAVWRDTNHNGSSESSELVSLAAAGVRSISLRYVTSKATDEWGNLYRYRSYAVTDRDMENPGPLKRRVIDVMLQVDAARPVSGAAKAPATQRTL
jgi:hypothetical protein